LQNKDIKSIGFALAPDNSPSFLLDWEVTKKCNLDCSYCPTDIETGGHNNSTRHPPLEECLESIDFMYEYVDLYMSQKKPTQRKVIFNLYGGESLYHPNIVEILKACREKYTNYKDRWELTIICTTNAIITKKIWTQVVDLIDYFTASYHAEILPSQEELFFDNLLTLKQKNKPCKCVVMMHSDPDKWPKSLNAIDFCTTHKIKYQAKPFDEPDGDRTYTPEQFDYMKNFWVNNTNAKNLEETRQRLDQVGIKKKVISIQEGRSCCGGRKLALNNALSSSVTFVPRQGFKGWYCSVNWFFLYVQQITGKVWTNKDCRTSLNSVVEHIGILQESEKILDELKKHFDNKSMPVIKCVKSICMCGYCAPKAENIEDFKDLITRNVITDVIKYD